MQIGVPKEVKNHEYRIGTSPAMVQALVNAGHDVFIEAGAGARVGMSDDRFVRAGAHIVSSAEEVYDKEMVIKVKEPQPSEYDLLKKEQILFTFLHLAPDPEQTEALLKKEVVGIAYETITDAQGCLPLLMPMSEIAGRVAIQAGASALQCASGGKGILLGGVPGVLPARVVVIGGGVVGTEAARMAMGLGASVRLLDNNLHRLRHLDALFHGRLKTLYSSEGTIERSVASADLVIGSVLIPGKSAPKLVTKEMIANMRPGSAVVDVAIDQGGCFETSRPTTHSDPTYIVDDVVHYCVTNMPGACALTATRALTNATLSCALKIANQGYKNALKDDVHLRNGLNVCLGKVTNQNVAMDLGYSYVSPEAAL